MKMVMNIQRRDPSVPKPLAEGETSTAPTLQAPEAEQAEVSDAYENERKVEDTVHRIEGALHAARPDMDFLVNVWHEPEEHVWVANVASADGSFDLTARGETEADACWALLAMLLNKVSGASLSP